MGIDFAPREKQTYRTEHSSSNTPRGANYGTSGRSTPRVSGVRSPRF
jgi:hypothetical protein